MEWDFTSQESREFEFTEVIRMKKTNKNTSMGMALGMCFGVSIGTSLGTVFDNISIGITFGVCFGMLIGLVLGILKDNKVNEQLEVKGYTIKTIEKNEENMYIVTIANKLGEECVVSVSKGEMDEEDFKIGDIVFLTDEGVLEQAYDKEDE